MINKYITQEQIKRMNDRTLNGVTDIRFKTPKTFRVVGVCLIATSFIIPDGSIGILFGTTLLISPSLKHIPNNFKMLLSSNIKKMKKGFYRLNNFIKYDSLGVKRF